VRFVVHALACIFFISPAAVAPISAAADFSIGWQTNSVVATGPFASSSETNWAKMFSVYAEQGNILTDINLPAISGTYTFVKNALTFKPQFPFEPGVNYRAVLRISEKLFSSTHKIPTPSIEPTTTVAAIYPGSDELPENLLKFYLLFSAPMSGGHIYEHIHLRNSDGKDVQLPFLEIDEEFWDPTMTRLTLFLDPGRIKRGVRPLEEIGPALQAGRSYTLWITRDWKDANGAPLKADFEKTFKVVAADREPPNPLRWKITRPKSKTKNPLTVVFDEPLDHALAQRILRIHDSKGAPVAGTVKLDAIDRTFMFTPNARWSAGVHKIVVPTIIEDLAGNNIGKPFDLDTAEDPRPLTNEVVTISFTVR
jgi:hypothetical protein